MDAGTLKRQSKPEMYAKSSIFLIFMRFKLRLPGCFRVFNRASDACRACSLHQAGDLLAQPAHLERLEQQRVQTGLLERRQILGIDIGGQAEHRRAACAGILTGTDPAGGFDAVHLGHHQVHQDQVVVLPGLQPPPGMGAMIVGSSANGTLVAVGDDIRDPITGPDDVSEEQIAALTAASLARSGSEAE